MFTFAIAHLNFFDNINDIDFVTAPSALDAMKIFAKDYFPPEDLDRIGLTIPDILIMFLDAEMSVSEPKMIPILK